MTAKEILEKVKAVFAGEIPAAPALAAPAPTGIPPAAPAPKKYKLQDGTEIEIAQAGDIPAVGDIVTISGAPATGGPYILEDGSSITVDISTGAITAVTPAQPVTTDTPTEPPIVPQAQMAASKELEEIKTQFSKVENDFNKKLELMQAANVRHEETIKGLFELVEKLTEIPTADPKTLTGAKKEQFDRAAKKEKTIMGIAEAISKMKKNK